MQGLPPRPQAKGRIERMWRTFQDRLRSELRLAQAASLEEANRVLDRFVAEYNQRFAVPAREAANDFRPLPKKVNLDRVFSLRYERIVGRDHVIPFGARRIQLPPVKGNHGYAGVQVELSQQLNGELHVWHGEEHLHAVKAPVEFAPGQAPNRPAQRTQKAPRIHVLGDRPATAVR